MEYIIRVHDIQIHHVIQDIYLVYKIENDIVAFFMRRICHSDV